VSAIDRRWHRRRGRWLLGLRRVALVAVGLGLAVGTAGALRSNPDPLGSIDLMLVAAGLGIDEIGISGYSHTSADDIFRALEVERPQSLLSYDAQAAQARIARLAWIGTVEIDRALPGRLSVRIAERLPYAVWQHHGMLFLIDSEGRELQPIGPAEYRLLPMVAGAGAASRAREILTLVTRHPEVASRFEVAVRVADRRWTLRLKGGIEVLLPERDAEKALELVSSAQAEERLLDRAIARIDMRVPGQMTLGLQPGAAPLRPADGA
jgi:cell division protein FtsQ